MTSDPRVEAACKKLSELSGDEWHRQPHILQEDNREVMAAVLAAADAARPAESEGTTAQKLTPAAVSQWRPIADAPKDGTQIICGHDKRRWIRFGRYYPELKRWYFSGTSERSQFAEIEGDAPTHFMPLPAPPKGGE